MLIQCLQIWYSIVAKNPKLIGGIVVEPTNYWVGLPEAQKKFTEIGVVVESRCSLQSTELGADSYCLNPRLSEELGVTILRQEIGDERPLCTRDCTD